MHKHLQQWGRPSVHGIHFHRTIAKRTKRMFILEISHQRVQVPIKGILRRVWFRVCEVQTRSNHQSQLASSFGRQSRSGIREYRGRKDRWGSLVLGLIRRLMRCFMSVSKAASHTCEPASWSPGAARGAKGDRPLALMSMKALWTKKLGGADSSIVSVTTSSETRKRVPCQTAWPTRKARCSKSELIESNKDIPMPRREAQVSRRKTETHKPGRC